MPIGEALDGVDDLLILHYIRVILAFDWMTHLGELHERINIVYHCIAAYILSCRDTVLGGVLQ